MKYTWDFCWKVFCDSSKPWGSWFISQLIGDAFEDYDVEVLPLTEVNVESQNAFQDKLIADKFFTFTVDEKKHTIHMEFQSTYDKSMGYRLLQYGLHHRERGEETVGRESWILPYSFLINVRDTKMNDVHNRELHLVINGKDISINYPVIDVRDKLPEIKTIMKAKSYDDVFEAAKTLSVKAGVPKDDSVDSELFWTACTAITSPKIFTEEGLEKSSLLKGVHTMATKRKSWYDDALDEGMEKGRKQSMEEAAKRVAENFNIDVETAYKIVTGTSTSKQESMKGMNLFKG